jgi:hypothetical protein
VLACIRAKCRRAVGRGGTVRTEKYKLQSRTNSFRLFILKFCRAFCVRLIPLALCTIRCALRIFPWGGGGGGGADPGAMCNLCTILKIMLQKSYCKYNITLFAAGFIYIQLKLNVPWLNHSVISSCFFLFYSFIFQNSNVLVISRLQWLILAEVGIALNIWYNIYKICVFFFNFGFGGLGGWRLAAAPAYVRPCV